MARPWMLDDFDTEATSAVSAETGLTEAGLEEERLAAFDRGYKDGWDDATATLDADQNRIDVEFGHNLQAMSFTYFEARAAMLAEMESLLRGILDAVLPPLLQASLGATVLERLKEAADRAANVEAEIVVAPDNKPRLDALLKDKIAPPVKVTVEPSLGEGQAFLKLGGSEEKIDLDGVLDEIRTAIAEFFARNESESSTEEPLANVG